MKQLSLLISLALVSSVSAFGCDDDEKKPQTSGGATSGGDTPGGDTPGGDTPGGDTPGGDTPGGATPGGATPGGATPGGDTPGGDTPGGDTPGGDTPGGMTSPLPATLAPADLVGTWAGACEAYPDGMGGTNYIDRQFTLTEDRWTIFGTIYGDDKCSFPLAGFRVSGPYTLGAGSAGVEGATEGNFYYETNEWVAYNADFAGVLSGAGCGAGGWVPYEPQSVIDTGCLTAHPASECPNGELDLVKIEGGELYFGERSVDLCAERAPRAGAYGLKKLPTALEIGVDNFYPEGVALDRYLPAYVGSIGTGTIYRHDGSAAAALYGTPYGLGGATVGMKVAGESLWTCVANTMTGATGVTKLSLATGEVQAQYPFPAPGFCNDLIVDAQGAVFATESAQGIIYKLAPGANEWTTWLSGYPADPAVGFGFNGLTLSPDGSSLLIGRADSGELLEVPFNAEGLAGTPVVSSPGGAPTSAGFDGLVSWRGAVYAVRDGAVVRLVKRGGAWESSVLLAAGRLEFPSTLSVDNHGNLWVVEAKLGRLLDGDDSTNATPPFLVHRLSPRTE